MISWFTILHVMLALPKGHSLRNCNDRRDITREVIKQGN